MAKLINVYLLEEINEVNVKRRQLPIKYSENQIFMMDLGNSGLTFDKNQPTEVDHETFFKKFNILSREEVKSSLQVTRNQFTKVLSMSVPCVGCRRSVERLLEQLVETAYPSIYPIVIHGNGNISIAADNLKSAKRIGSVLHESDKLLNDLVEHQQRNKKSSRCSLHSLDSFRSKTFSDMWRDVWNSMNKRCKEEISIIESDELYIILENYLKKHKFCTECRTKVGKAYDLLLKEENPKKEDGYVASLYSGIKRCVSKKHIHVSAKNDHIDNLIKKAEPELNGSLLRHRERHAKTLEIAQQEVLTCIGMCIYEKLRRIHICLKEEENACQVLASVSVFALSRNFDMAVENKRGISNLELLYEELSREEKIKEQRKEQKKLKKRKKRIERRHHSSFNYNKLDMVDSKILIKDNQKDKCFCSVKYNERQDIIHDGNCLNKTDTQIEENDDNHPSTDACHTCSTNAHYSLDAGYSSETLHERSTSNTPQSSSINSSPEGSEIACSDEYCNHLETLLSNPCSKNLCYVKNQCRSNCFGMEPGSFTLSLAQMLDDSHHSDEDIGEGIPDELISDFKARYANVKKEREELRKRLVSNFNRLCATANVKEHYKT